jgi:hypothetical protein
MKQRMLVGWGLVALGMIVLGTPRRKGHGERPAGDLWSDGEWGDGWWGDGGWGDGWWGDGGWADGWADESSWQAGSVELDAAPVLKVRGTLNDVSVVRADGPRIVVSAPDAADGYAGFFARRVEDRDGPAVIVDVHPRRRVELRVPSGTAVQLMFAKSRIEVDGIDDVDVFSAKSEVTLNEVAGTVRIRSAKDRLGVALAAERETRAVDVSLAKSSLELDVPAARGGAFRIRAAKSSVTAPPSTAGGVPVKVLAARSNVVVRAA